MKYKLIFAAILLVTLSAGLIYSCGQSDKSAGKTRKTADAFVGDEACVSCHRQKVNSWKGSHHDYAMRAADSFSVRADFNNVTYTHQGKTYRFFRQEGRYMVEAPGPDDNRQTYEITHTFGWAPLQQYLVDFGRGKLQALNVAWDIKKERWFSMNPDQKVEPGDWLHWTGGAMNWNTMCANCHSTQLEQNYMPEADSFHTTWSSINVSCEACHGPGRDHVKFMGSERSDGASRERIRRDLKLTDKVSQEKQINTCARCHSLREKLVDGYDHGKSYMDHYNPTVPHPPQYFADGQIKEEVYVYGSFLQSKMFQEGVKCSDCHDPHSLELKKNVKDNSLCMQCHDPSYDSPEHHFHKANTRASRCINCHMPGRYYMEVDFRRDHSFKVPRPDLSAKFGTPNACNNCHDSRSPQWAAETINKWYGPEREDKFAGTLLRADSLGPEALPGLRKLVTDTSQPEIVRATGAWYLGQFPGRQSQDLLRKLTSSQSSLIRNSAVRALSSMPPDIKKAPLTDVLSDSLRAVRIGAAQGLTEFSAADFVPGTKKRFNKAMDEYMHYLDVNRYFPWAQMKLGQYYEDRGKPQKAIQAYNKALEKDPLYNPARINLAYVYNRQGRKDRARNLLEKVIEQEPEYGPAHYSLGLLLAEIGTLQDAIARFEKAAELMPDHARVRYNLAISYQKQQKPKSAEKMYKQAIELAPQNPEYRYGICTLYIQQEAYKKALPHARRLIELQPSNQRYQKLLRMVESRVER